MAKDGYIPLEILVEIMKKLPVKSLMRFRSVSKSWKSLIHSSKFIVDYRGQQPQLLVFCRGIREDYSKTKFILIADDDTFPRHKIYLPVPIINCREKTKIGTGSLGLICFYSKNLLLFWNPSIRKTVSIDVPDLLDSPYHTYFGFGVCPSTYDPKVVKIIVNSKLKEIYAVEVFTLSSRVWRSPHSNLPRKSIYVSASQVYIDGFIYWAAYDYIPLPDGSFRRSKLIMSFCVTSEEFTEICYPNSSALINNDISFCISKLRESLLVVENHYTDRVKGVWMMMNHGDPKSFTKLFNINLAEAVITSVFGFRNSGEAIVKHINDLNNALYVYEPNSNHIRSVILGTTSPAFSGFLGNYTETLLLLDY